MARSIKIVLILWGAAALLAAIPFMSTKGHPPAFALLPFIAVLWLVGHLAIWLPSRLVGRFRPAMFPVGCPRSVMLVAAIFAVAFLVGLAILSMQFFFGHALLWIWVQELLLWSLTAVAWLALLARAPWSRHFSAGLLAAATIAFLWVALVGLVLEPSWVLGMLGLAGASLLAWLAKEMALNDGVRRYFTRVDTEP